MVNPKEASMIVIVTGMHRSGTSAMAGFLHLNGIKMGRKQDFHPRPNGENKKGFYENKAFRNVNDKWLANGINGNKYHVKRWKEDPIRLYDKNPTKADLEPAHKMISIFEADFQKSKDVKGWGWKDPRTCLTLSWWLEALKGKDVRIVIMNRDLEAIGRSLRKRNNCSIERGVELARQYHKICAEHLSKYPHVPYTWVSFDLLIKQPGHIERRLSSFLGCDINSKAAVKFLDPKLKHW